MARRMPAQKPGDSKQDYQTPKDFLDAAKRRLGIFYFGLDIAASNDNAVAKLYFSEKDDCFAQKTWRAPKLGAWSWLNPEFDDIARYAARCCFERDRHDAKIAFLVPGSIGANWWKDSVHGHGLVLALNGRITFVGQPQSYPKDCALILYAPTIAPGYDVWTWRG